ncbi:Signal transduction histidine kinase [Parafrankia irregularis]|uniref:histidine kinase n=1 Tax=Parafrankia irregularis TaxID=795642 RepID=A0A0S4QSN0_9ACTN|nr:MULTISPECIES: histidine kinase [Parafrankia]MBE3205957.1 histidine kinase [Parafrankia sp. CH37]CUU58094.1 Signal transduction histidine kinase [Parafrankia irregularis]
MSDGLSPEWLAVRGFFRSRPAVLDVLVSLVVFGLGTTVTLTAQDGEAGEFTALSILLSSLAALALLARRRWPVAVVAVITALIVVGSVTGQETPVLSLAVGSALYTTASRWPGATAWYCALAAGLTMSLLSLLQGPALKEIVPLWTWIGLSTVAGYSVRGRRDYIAAVEERAIRAELGREQEARRQVAEERLRIARELHDVVGHHVVLINVQSAVAAHVLRVDPDKAEESLGHVRQAGRTVLDELNSLVRVLRDPDEPSLSGPVRGLEHLDELTAGFAAAGLPLELHRDGQPRELPVLIDLAAYRIVQESLTNAYKHARGAPTTLCLAYGQHELGIQIRSGGADAGSGTGPAGAGAGAGAGGGAGAGQIAHRLADFGSIERDIVETGPTAGHGITGMRERAAALGGRLRAGRTPDGAFTVLARLPVPPPLDEHDPRQPRRTVVESTVVVAPEAVRAAEAVRTTDAVRAAGAEH